MRNSIFMRGNSISSNCLKKKKVEREIIKSRASFSFMNNFKLLSLSLSLFKFFNN